LTAAAGFRKLISGPESQAHYFQIRKAIAGKIAVAPGELETLIFTRPKGGIC
jgi:hypothetical protein